MIDRDEIRRIILDDRCSGRVLVVGTGGRALEFVTALSMASRVTKVIVIEPDWAKAKRIIPEFASSDTVEVRTDEYDVALRPPVDQFDLAVVCVPYGDLTSFIEEVVPFIHLLSNRGWVADAHSVITAGITRQRLDLMAFIAKKMTEALEDTSLLEHLATETTKDPIREECQPFFVLVNSKIREHGVERMGAFLDDWIWSFATVAFEPGAMQRLASWVEYDLTSR